MDVPFMIALKPRNDGSGGSGGGIASVDINDKGELVIVMDDGRVRNLGRIVGADGAVYVPHISDEKVLSFTIEKEPAEVPSPVDLNKGVIDSSEVATEDEVNEMLEEIFGKQGGGSGGEDIDESRVATDEEVKEMLNEVFGKQGEGSGGQIDDAQVVTDEEVAEVLKEVFGF